MLGPDFRLSASRSFPRINPCHTIECQSGDPGGPRYNDSFLHPHCSKRSCILLWSGKSHSGFTTCATLMPAWRFISEMNPGDSLKITGQDLKNISEKRKRRLSSQNTTPK